MLRNLSAVLDAGRWLLYVGMAVMAARQAAEWLDREYPGRRALAWVATSGALKSVGSAAFVASLTIVCVVLALTDRLAGVLIAFGLYGFIIILGCLVCWLLDWARSPRKR